MGWCSINPRKHKCTFLFIILSIISLAVLVSNLNETSHAFSNKVYTRKVRCLKDSFKDTLLVLNFNYPFYENIQLLHELYHDVFGKVVMCGPQPNNEAGKGPDILYYEEKIWYFRYRCLTKAIERYPGYTGKHHFSFFRNTFNCLFGTSQVNRSCFHPLTCLSVEFRRGYT